jgi:predicted peroxiredoxin
MNTTKKATQLQGNKLANNNPTKVTGNVITQNATKVKIDKVVFLADNVTGKQLLNAKLEANKLNKEELQSLSFCINQFKKHGANVIACINGLNMEHVTPKNILPFLSEAEKIRLENNGNKFTVWLVENLVIRLGKESIKHINKK